MTSDMDYIDGTTGEVDSNLNAVWGDEGAQEAAGVGEESVGLPPIPRFNYWYGEVSEVDGRVQPFEGGKIEGVVTFKVLEGPAGFANRYIRGTMILVPKTTKFVAKGEPELELSESDKAKELGNFRNRVNRIVNVLKLTKSRPAGLTPAQVKLWLSPAVGQKAIFVASTDKKGYTFIPFESLRAEGDPAKDYSKSPAVLIPGKTALELAREEIAKFGAPKTGAGRRGATAAGRGAAAPSDFS